LIKDMLNLYHNLKKILIEKKIIFQFYV